MKYLVDSDFLISFSSDLDSTHQESVEIYKKIKDGSKLVALNLVFQESTTVVSKKFGMQKAKIFYEMINKFINTRIIMNEDVEKEAWKMFLQQSKKGTSFIDCANLAAYKKYKLDGILSFDEFYSKNKINHPKDARINLV